MNAVQKDSLPIDPIPVSEKESLNVPFNFCASLMDTGINEYTVDITRLKEQSDPVSV